jgi:hypothetical protein
VIVVVAVSLRPESLHVILRGTHVYAKKD